MDGRVSADASDTSGGLWGMIGPQDGIKWLKKNYNNLKTEVIILKY